MRLVIANLRITNMLKTIGVKKDIAKSDIYDQHYLQAIGGIVLVISIEGDIVFVSNNVASYLGISQVDLLGHSFFDMIHPCDHQDIRDLLSGKMKVNGQISLFVRVKCSQSSKGRTINLKAASYKVLHIIGRYIKIDESPKERFGFVTVATPIPHPADIEIPLGSHTFLSKHSLDMKFTYADERMTEFLGYNPDDLIGESLYNFHHVEDNKEIMKSFKSLFEKGQSETCRYRFMAQGGGYIWVCTQATVLYCDKKNIPLSVVCVNYVISGKHNEIEICSREQIEWIKDKNDTELSQVFEKTKLSEIFPATVNPSSSCVTTPANKTGPYSSTAQLLSAVQPVKPDQINAGQSPRPRLATSEIFAPRTADMDKGFLTFSDDESGLTELKEEPEDLTHLAPTAGDACVPLSIPPFLCADVMSDILSDDYSPLINHDKKTPLFSSYSSDNPSRSMSPVLTQNNGSGGLNTLCSLVEDCSSPLEDGNPMGTLLCLDLDEPDKTAFIDLPAATANTLPLLTPSDLLWDDVSNAASLLSQSYSLGVEIRTDSIEDFSCLASFLQSDDETVTKSVTCPQRAFTAQHSPQRNLLDFEKRKRLSSVQDEAVKKRKHGPPDSSVLMNLLIDGRDINTGYNCFDGNRQDSSSISLSSSIDP
ncbi:hypothetical protein O3M35_004513 [Rhynocoris fuscipes]|uniref:PAS domain-containing protein n=1 Tax=Rhynocoris fuscipes TaxID=488301 RepID=A0AAW1CIE9_9HEMI